MRKIMFLMLAFTFLITGVSFAGDEGCFSTGEERLEETKPLDLGEPTPEEKSRMGREAKDRHARESGFDESLTDDASTEEIAGDDSEARWEFN